MGIHQVPVTQENTVKLFMNGRIECRNGASSELSINSIPASMEIAIEPMLIQCGGDRSAGENRKNV